MKSLYRINKKFLLLLSVFEKSSLLNQEYFSFRETLNIYTLYYNLTIWVKKICFPSVFASKFWASILLSFQMLRLCSLFFLLSYSITLTKLNFSLLKYLFCRLLPRLQMKNPWIYNGKEFHLSKSKKQVILNALGFL